LQAAQQALALDDLIAAAVSLRHCQRLSRLPSPACDGLLRQVEDRFIVRQLEAGQAAAHACAAETAAQALYRCQLMDPTRPACQQLVQLVSEARACPASPPPQPPATRAPRRSRRQR
jgi:hypothetical protein